MNKIILAAVALATFGSVAAQADGGRDPSLYGRQAPAQIVEGRNAAVALPASTDGYIKASVEQDARSSR
ncbi:hypothetical protein Snov_0706 [Ancylobacter novellus DSM 506]|uniref:DUF4148 domain-containing protein n=1 Tax=Ancylobacter novellus (strain ATCC 8093 / DSM 506 / JCM 20403 / CCM 1077 / IAM 12100 / NBRC 12443 / NCIMB 10456) TaxID=639283 RepID=D7A4Y9_ANCN5|nr:hypothetical protein [Ancylobacter novellus]ADH88037.1 hypothetical protein Snov_0706 [Ancylobacter novellus DSM 506]